MKELIFALFCSVLMFTAKAPVSHSPELATGIYLVDSNSSYQLTLNNKPYGIDKQPICGINDFNSVDVNHHLVNGKEVYFLELKLNSAGSEKLKKVTVSFAQKKYLGLVIKGKLKSVSWLVNQIVNGEVSMTGSKQLLEDVQDELKREMK